MTKRIWMFFALAALALAGVAAYLYSGASGMRAGDRGLASSKDAAADERRPGSSGAVDEDASTSDSASKPRAPASMAKTAPLPPLETPLRAVVAALTERAEAGDARAMCRLAAEYQYCSGLRMRMKMIESGVARAQAAAETGGDAARGGGRFGGAERIGEAFEDVSAKYAHCEGVEIPSNTEIARYMRESAIAGHTKAASYYATGDVFRSRDTLSTLAELSLYRENAERLANAAVAQGDTRAAWALAEAYASDPDDPRRSLLAQAVRPAPEKALSLLYGLRAASERGAGQVDQNGRFAGRLQQRIATLEKELGPEAAQRARSAPSPIAEGASFDVGAEAQRGGGFMRGFGDFPREICD